MCCVFVLLNLYIRFCMCKLEQNISSQKTFFKVCCLRHTGTEPRGTYGDFVWEMLGPTTKMVVKYTLNFLQSIPPIVFAITVPCGMHWTTHLLSASCFALTIFLDCFGTLTGASIEAIPLSNIKPKVLSRNNSQ